MEKRQIGNSEIYITKCCNLGDQNKEKGGLTTLGIDGVKQEHCI